MSCMDEDEKELDSDVDDMDIDVKDMDHWTAIFWEKANDKKTYRAINSVDIKQMPF